MAGNAYIGASGYTRVEYIQSSGAQYIDTGFKPNNNTRVVMDFQFVSAPTSDHAVIFGARDATNVNSFCVFYIKDGYFRSDYGTTNTNQWAINSTARYTIDKNKETTSIGNTTQSYSATTFKCNYNMYLFALNTGGALGFGSKGLKVYSCQIYDNGTLVRDFVPCINAKGVAGLYDAVNGVFYANAGTGSFATGETCEALGSEYVARKVGTIYIGDRNGVAREIKKAYFGDKNGLAQEWFLGRTTWAKYNCVRSGGETWTKNDNYHATVSTQLMCWFGSSPFYLDYSFSEKDGFTGDYIYGGTSFEPDATSEEVADFFDGAYYINNTGDTYQRMGRVVGVSGIGYIGDDYITPYFRIEYFSEATRSPYVYSKGSTSYGKFIVEYGELPESGTLIEGSVEQGYFVLRIGSTYYYYVLEE